MVATEAQPLKTYQITIPLTYRLATASPQAPQWKQAMDTAIQKFLGAKAFEYAIPPRDAILIPGKWVFDVKSDENNCILQYRARWVICGNRQRPGVDFDERSSPVASDQAIKLFFTMIATQKLYHEHFDVVTAYLNAAIDDRIVWMRQPTGFEKNASDGRPMACRLLQALWGLRQAGFLWYKRFTKELTKLAFQPLPDEPCVFKRTSDNTFILIYVDDAIIAASTRDAVYAIKQNLKEAFNIKELGTPSCFLGCNIDYHHHCIVLSQQAYVEELLAQKVLTNCKPMPIPMQTTYQVPKTTSTPTVTTHEIDLSPDEDHQPSISYAEDIGKLGWLATKTRLDILYAVRRLQRRMAAPRNEDIAAIRHILRYLKASPNYALHLGADPTQKLHGYVDASFADCEDGKSTEAYIFFCAGCPISWYSHKQNIVTPSSSVAEYCAIATAAKEAVFLQKLAHHMNLVNDDPIPLYTDRKSVV